MIRWLLLALSMGVLLLPRDTILPNLSAILLVIPLAIAGIRDHSTFRYWAVYVIGFFGFAYLRDLGDQLLPVLVRYPILLDQVLAMGSHPVVLIQQAYTPGNPRWWDYAALTVHMSYFVAIPFTGILLWKSDRLRPLLLGAVVVYLSSVAVCILLPTAPPWMAGQMKAMPTVYRIIGDVLGGSTPGFYEYGLRVAGSNPVAAMPSVHAAAGFMVGLASWRTSWAWAGFGYAVAMGLSLVYLGEHYVVDVLAGWVLAVFCWRWVSLPVRTPPPPPGQPPE